MKKYISVDSFLCSPALWHLAGGFPPFAAPKPGLSCVWPHAAAGHRAEQYENSCCCSLCAGSLPPLRGTPLAPAGLAASPAVPAAARAPPSALPPPSGWWWWQTACSNTTHLSVFVVEQWRCRSNGLLWCLRSVMNVSECSLHEPLPSVLRPLVCPRRALGRESNLMSASSPWIYLTSEHNLTAKERTWLELSQDGYNTKLIIQKCIPCFDKRTLNFCPRKLWVVGFDCSPDVSLQSQSTHLSFFSWLEFICRSTMNGQQSTSTSQNQQTSIQQSTEEFTPHPTTTTTVNIINT